MPGSGYFRDREKQFQIHLPNYITIKFLFSSMHCFEIPAFGTNIIFPPEYKDH